tara:strand:+ start:36970 stop:37965 length:996 start_codon:yes stop_codon:yes gene_type:complete
MKSIYKNHYFPNKIFTKKYAKDFKTKVLQEEVVVVNNPLIDGKTREVFLDGIKISIRNGKLNPPFIIDVEHDFPFLKIHFEIEGSSKYTPKNEKSIAVIIPGGHYNFFFLPEVKGTLRYDNPTRKTLEILFTKDYLKRIFGKSFKEECSEFGDALENNEPFLMWKQSRPITTQLQAIINEIINCKFDVGLKKVYLESKITEILTIFFNDLKNKRNRASINEKLSEEDYLKILHAETIVKKNFKNPLTISQLAIISGINQFKLKKNFKLIFGKPIFSYLTEMRMEKAKKMIVDQGYTIAEAAYEIGYKNPQHFTAAFKRMHNYLPSTLKKKV